MNWNRTNRTTLLFFLLFIFLTKKWTSAVCRGCGRTHRTPLPTGLPCSIHMSSPIAGSAPGASKQAGDLGDGGFDCMIPQIGDKLRMFELICCFECIVKAVESLSKLGFQFLFTSLAAGHPLSRRLRFLTSNPDVESLNPRMSPRVDIVDFLLVQEIFLVKLAGVTVHLKTVPGIGFPLKH